MNSTSVQLGQNYFLSWSGYKNAFLVGYHLKRSICVSISTQNIFEATPQNAILTGYHLELKNLEGFSRTVEFCLMKVLI